MCIRDSYDDVAPLTSQRLRYITSCLAETPIGPIRAASSYSCLLYTSDAADERSSVDLGGRRIIKKKNN